MKKNLGMFLGVPSCGAGAVLMALCAFTSVSRADLVINNLGDTTIGGFNDNLPLAQVFTMSGTSGNISSLTLEVNVFSTGSAVVDLYSVTGGAPNTLIAALGNINAVATGNYQDIAVSSLNNYLLTAGTSYAIVLQPTSGSGTWEYTTTAGAGAGALGSLGSAYYNFSGWNQNSGSYMQMNLTTTPVPEVPMTGVIMGFGALAIVLGRKLRLAVSSVA